MIAEDIMMKHQDFLWSFKAKVCDKKKVFDKKQFGMKLSESTVLKRYIS